ncbi:MAG TPA: hypothetical protein V6C97_29260 [Oculatellaceae cyanobacterium]
MAPNDNAAKAESVRDKPPESAQGNENSAHHSFFKELAVSAAYSGVEQPALGISQFAGNDAMNSVKKTFEKIGIEKPTEAKTFSSTWYAQNVGGALGMVIPYTLTKLGLNKLGTFGKVGAEESSLLSQRAALNASLKESAVTGMVYGTFFTPSEERTRQAGLISFLADRGVSGVGTAATFTTLTAGSAGLERLSKTARITEIGAAPVLRNKIVAGTLSGLPAGIVSTEYESITKKHTLASGDDLAKSMLSMSTVGFTFGTASLVSGGLASPSKGTPPETRIAKPERSGNESTTHEAVPKTGAPETTPPKVIVSSDATAIGGSKKITEPTAGTIGGPEAPKVINPNEFSTRADQAVRLELTPQEQDIWRQIQSARTPEQFESINHQIDEHVPSDRSSWFTQTLDRQSLNLSDHELGVLWPEVLQNDPHQGYRIAKSLGPERTTKLWQQQLESVKETGNPQLANELAKTLVYLEPQQQLPAVEALLSLEQPPAYIEMAPATLTPEHQMAAAQMLVGKGITPTIDIHTTSPATWANWALDLEPGQIRNGLLEQIGRKVIGSNAQAPEVLNSVLRVAQSKEGTPDYATFNSMLSGINPKKSDFGGREIRTKALQDIDPKFIARMMFEQVDWARSDQIAEQNPELIRSIATNSKYQADAARSSYITSIMTSEPPMTIEQLASSIAQQAKQGAEGAGYLLTPGDIEALAEHGPPVPPETVPSLLNALKSDVFDTFDLEGSKPVSRERLVSILTLANSLAKANPGAFESNFKEPIESALANSNLPYPRRLDAARALGELQRGGFEGAAHIQMPELRMGKLADLTPEQQTEMRKSVEKSLYSRDAIQAQLGDGPLGRLLPSIFGDAAEGGIVGRQQHKTHDNALDHHILDVVDKAGKDPAFAKLMPRDQVNVLWASLLHDIGKRENMMDLDHNWTSTSMAWGILRTLGYPDSRIQRITDIMSKDSDLSFDPDNKNSVRLADPKTLDGVVNSYRHADALNMVAILNRADIKSVKNNEAWWKPEVSDELDKIHEMAQARVAELNRHLLPVLPSELPQGFGAYEISDYNVLGHATSDVAGTLKGRSTIESPEYSISVSLLTPENRHVYDENSQELALVIGPFEHIAQASRENLSTGTSVGWNGHVQLVDRWATDGRARELAQSAESRLEGLGIPAARNVAPENFPRLAQLRRVLGQFDNSTELRNVAGADDPYVQAANAINQVLTTDRNGAPLKRNNEIKLNNPVVSGVGILRRGNQPVYFADMSPADLSTLWHGNVPDFVSAGPAASAPAGSFTVRPELVASAKKNNLPIVILNDGNH